MSPRNRQTSVGQLRLLLEPLEDRQLLSAASLTSSPTPDSALAVNLAAAQVAPFNVEAGSAGPAIVVSPADAASDTITVYRHGAAVASYLPAADTDVDRGIALRTALSEAQAEDEVVLGAFTFDMGGDEHLDIPAHVTLTGAGKTATRLTSSCPIFVDGADCFTLNNQSVVQDLWLEGTLQNGWYQTLVGLAGGPTEDVTTYLRRVKITGDSDGIYIWTGQIYQYSLYAYDCDISTRYDAVALLGSGLNSQMVKLYNCTLTVSQPDAIPAHTSNCVNLRSGVAELYGCTLTATGDANSVQTTGVMCYNQGFGLVVDCTFNATSPAGIAVDFLMDYGSTLRVVGGSGSGENGAYTSYLGTEFYTTLEPATVASRGLFYNDSAFDDQNPSIGFADAGAVAPDKTPLLPGGGLSGFANVSSYNRGLNGIFVDLVGIHGNITTDDFTFAIGNDNSPAGWAAAPAPQSVVVMGGAGVNGSDRVELIWGSNAVKEHWLEVQVLATAHTGLSAPDMFYWGSKIGDTGSPSATNFSTTVAGDGGPIMANLGAGVGIESVLDIDRSSSVTVAGDRGSVLAKLGTINRLNLDALSNSPTADPAATTTDADVGVRAEASLTTSPTTSTRPQESATRGRPSSYVATPEVVSTTIASRTQPLTGEDARRITSTLTATDDDAAHLGPRLDSALVDVLAARWGLPWGSKGPGSRGPR